MDKDNKAKKIDESKTSVNSSPDDVSILKRKSVEKVIFHMDGDAFFVACEVAKNPKLKGLPVVTGEERGIVSALSYEAKALGITRGMPIYKVKNDFPKVLVLPGDYRSYAKYSSQMFDIVRRYADDVEEYSIDECFADLTGLEPPLKMTYGQIAERIKREVNEELGLSVSIGLAPSKVLAKVASKWVKPNGLTIIESGAAPDFLRQISIGKIWGIGPRTSETLIKKGINTALDFSSKDIDWVRRNLSKQYEAIWLELNGVYIMEIDSKPKTVYSSVQKTRTFHPATNDKVFLLSQLSKHMEEACVKVRHYGLAPKKISFFLKTQDFEYATFSISLASPTNAPEILIPLITANFDEMVQGSKHSCNNGCNQNHKHNFSNTKKKVSEWGTSASAAYGSFKRAHSLNLKNPLYRTAGVTLHDLVPSSLNPNSSSHVQGDLFNDAFAGVDKAHKFELIHKQIDSLEDKYGKRVVYLASTHKSLKRGTNSKSKNYKNVNSATGKTNNKPDESEGTDMDDLDRDLLFL